MAANSEGAGDTHNVFFYFSTAPPPPNPNPQLQHPPPYGSLHHQHPQPSFSPLRFPQFNPNQKQMGSTSDSCFLGPARFPLPLMRQMCDVFVMPRVEGSIGGSQSFVDRASLDCHKQVAEMALKAFNTDKKRNLKLLKVNKVNLISTNYCATFEAMEDGSGECFVLRVVVNFTTGNGVSLCEIKDGDNKGEGNLPVADLQTHYLWLRKMGAMRLFPFELL